MVSAAGLAVASLTAQLNQMIQEKNNILSQFFSQQNLIKQQQGELKGLLRCKSENTDLTSQISTHARTITVSSVKTCSFNAQSSNLVELVHMVPQLLPI